MNKRTKKSALLKQPIHRLITVEEFLRRVKKDPKSTWTDFDVRYAIEILQNPHSSNGELSEETARHILDKAGLRAYIPKKGRGVLSRYKNDLSQLIWEVKTVEKELRKQLPARGRQREDVKAAIMRMLESKGYRKPPSLPPTEQLGSVRDIALFAIAIQNGVSFRTLRNFYYKIAPDIKNYPETKVISSDMPVKFIRKIQKDTESHFYVYNEAYLNYIHKEHIKERIISWINQLNHMGIGVEFVQRVASKKVTKAASKKREN